MSLSNHFHKRMPRFRLAVSINGSEYLDSRFHKWLMSLSNHFYKRLSKARQGYSYYPIYDLKSLQLAGYSVCLVVTRHFFLVSSSLSSIMSSKAMQLEASCGCKLMAVGKLRLGCCCCTTWVR